MASILETAGAGSTSATNTVTVTLATGPSIGETLIAVVHHTDDFPATPSGWTKYRESVQNGVVAIFGKASDGTEGTSYVFTAPSPGGMAARVLRVSGLGIEDTAATANGSSTGTWTSGNLTTTTANTFLVGGVGMHATTLPTGDAVPASPYTNVAADIKTTNPTSRKTQLSVATRTASSIASYDYTGTFTPGGVTNVEAALVAWQATDPNGAVTAVRAIGSGAAGVPTVVGGGAAVVAAVRAQGTGLASPPVAAGVLAGAVVAVRAIGWGVAEAPAADLIVELSGGGAASGTGAAGVPTVTASGAGNVQAIRAQGTGTAVAPSIPQQRDAVAATGTGAAGVPTVIAGGRVVSVRAIGTGQARIPVVVGSASQSGAVNAVAATGTGTAGIGVAQMVETLPTNVGTGRVTGRFARAKVLVGDIDGLPNLYPIVSEQITFTSTAPLWTDVTASPAAITIIPEPIVCTLDSQGYLTDSAGHLYVDLVATDDPQLAPASRKWRVTFSASFGISPFEMTVLESATVDLATKIPT